MRPASKVSIKPGQAHWTVCWGEYGCRRNLKCLVTAEPSLPYQGVHKAERLLILRLDVLAEFPRAVQLAHEVRLVLEHPVQMDSPNSAATIASVLLIIFKTAPCQPLAKTRAKSSNTSKVAQ